MLEISHENVSVCEQIGAPLYALFLVKNVTQHSCLIVPKLISIFL